jgi:hypothetical protein
MLCGFRRRGLALPSDEKGCGTVPTALRVSSDLGLGTRLSPMAKSDQRIRIILEGFFQKLVGYGAESDSSPWRNRLVGVNSSSPSKPQSETNLLEY